eukprot:6326350-Alexandrium_andersonii.AAC.1
MCIRDRSLGHGLTSWSSDGPRRPAAAPASPGPNPPCSRPPPRWVGHRQWRMPRPLPPRSGGLPGGSAPRAARPLEQRSPGAAAGARRGRLLGGRRHRRHDL